MSGENLESKESKLATKENVKEEAISAKAQYAALGIDVSEESSLETESEWEASRKAKKMMENAKTDDAKKVNLDINDNSIKSQEESENSKRNIENTENEGEKDKNDSEFISDESFSLNTEGQLEELEEMRLKKVEEDVSPSKDFDDSDFSFSQSSEKTEPKDENSLEPSNRDELENEASIEDEASGRSELSKQNSVEEESDVEESDVEESEEMLMEEDGKIEGDDENENIINEFMNEQGERADLGGTRVTGSPKNMEVTDTNDDLEGIEANRKNSGERKEIEKKAEFFRNILNSPDNAGELTDARRRMDGTISENSDIHETRQVSDADRKKSLETMLNAAKPVAMKNIESEITVEESFMERTEPGIEEKERANAQEGQPNKKDSEENAVAEHELLDELEEIEEEFERKLREKEMESMEPFKAENDRTRNLQFEEDQSNDIDVRKGIEVRKQLLSLYSNLISCYVHIFLSKSFIWYPIFVFFRFPLPLLECTLNKLKLGRDAVPTSK